MASGDTKTNQYLDIAAHGSRADLQRGCCNTRTQDLIMDVAERIITEEETRAREDGVLQDEIDELKNNPDVTDIVATYVDLQNYDTSTLTDKDIIRVLVDETHDGQSTYYRWDATDQEFDYVGTVGDYYTKTQVDVLLDGKQDVLTAGENITIEDESGSLVISSTGGSNYTAGDGIDITNGVVKATNTGKAKELTTVDYNYPTNNPNSVALWKLPDGLYSASYINIQLTKRESVTNARSLFLVNSDKTYSVKIYRFDNIDGRIEMYRCALDGTTSFDGTEFINATDVQDNLTSTNTNKPLSAKQGKVLNDKIEARIAQNAGAPTTSTVGTVGGLLEDTTNGVLYMLTSITSVGGQSVYHWERIAPIPTLTDVQYNALWSNPNPLTSLLTTISTGTGV